MNKKARQMLKENERNKGFFFKLYPCYLYFSLAKRYFLILKIPLP